MVTADLAHVDAVNLATALTKMAGMRDTPADPPVHVGRDAPVTPWLKAQPAMQTLLQTIGVLTLLLHICRLCALVSTFRLSDELGIKLLQPLPCSHAPCPSISNLMPSS